MTENFLHYIWKYKKFNFLNLKTTEGEAVNIINTGTYNTHAGPDFLNSIITIGTTKWAGNVEIHINASDWMRHSHQKDPSYNNVILHVVYNNDLKISRNDGSSISCLDISKYIQPVLYTKYLQLTENKDWIPCQNHIGAVDSFHIRNWIDRVLTERLEEKTRLIETTLHLNKNNWEETFYQHMARSFGFKTNALPFELTAKSLPLQVLAKHKHNLMQSEALIFGQAGFLEDIFNDEYPRQLQKEYDFLRRKYKLEPQKKHLWKFLRMPPVNFPSIRLAQFAALIHQSSHLFSKILEAQNKKELVNLLSVEASSYWTGHYKFDQAADDKVKKLGKNAIEILVINTIVPFLFIYGRQKGNEAIKERAMNILAETPPEKNNIISRWKTLNISATNAFDTQGLIQLHNNYCTKKRCLNCGIGNKILKI